MSTAVLEERRESGRPPSCPPALTIRIIRVHQVGLSYGGIAAVLNEEHVPLPCGGSRWLKSSIDRILHTRYATRLVAALSTLPPAVIQQSPAGHDVSKENTDSHSIPSKARTPHISPNTFRAACATGRIGSDGAGWSGGMYDGAVGGQRNRD